MGVVVGIVVIYLSSFFVIDPFVPNKLFLSLGEFGGNRSPLVLIVFLIYPSSHPLCL